MKNGTFHSTWRNVMFSYFLFSFFVVVLSLGLLPGEESVVNKNGICGATSDDL
jgi:hypothetical protein